MHRTIINSKQPSTQYPANEKKEKVNSPETNQKAISINTSNKQRRVIALVFRYCKSHSIKDIPTDIIQLIHQFYEGTVYWKIKGDEMKKFLNAENGDIIHNKSTIIIKDIEFECRLSPNGFKTRSKGDVLFYLQIIYVPQDIEYLIVCMKLDCETLNINYDFLRH